MPVCMTAFQISTYLRATHYLHTNWKWLWVTEPLWKQSSSSPHFFHSHTIATSNEEEEQQQYKNQINRFVQDQWTNLKNEVIFHQPQQPDLMGHFFLLLLFFIYVPLMVGVTHLSYMNYTQREWKKKSNLLWVTPLCRKRCLLSRCANWRLDDEKKKKEVPWNVIQKWWQKNCSIDINGYIHTLQICYKSRENIQITAAHVLWLGIVSKVTPKKLMNWLDLG